MAPQEINKIVGPQFLSVLVNSGLLGVLSVQVYLYYLAFPNDRTHLKCLVYGIYILEFVQSVFIIEAVFRTCVTDFGNVEASDRIYTLWLSVPIFTAIDTFLVQGYYAHRIRIMGKSKRFAGVIICFSFIQLVGGIALGVFAIEVYAKQPKNLSLSKFLIFQTVSLSAWNVGSILCDIMIAMCMTYYLSRYDTTIKQTKIILKKVIRLTIGTGSLTAVIGIVCFLLSIFEQFDEDPNYYKFPMGIIGKVYANSMLVLINSRMLLDSEETPSTIFSALRFATIHANDESSAIHGDVALDTETLAGNLRSSHAERG